MGRCKNENAAYLRELREKARAQGLCYVCRCRPVKPLRASCQECLDRVHAAKEAHAQAGRCRCGKECGEGLKRCLGCNAAMLRRQKCQVRKARSAGNCTRCKKWPSVDGARFCLVCQRRYKEAQARRYHDDARTGACVRCRKAPAGGTRYCEPCRVSFNEYRRDLSARKRGDR